MFWRCYTLSVDASVAVLAKYAYGGVFLEHTHVLKSITLVSSQTDQPPTGTITGEPIVPSYCTHTYTQTNTDIKTQM